MLEAYEDEDKRAEAEAKRRWVEPVAMALEIDCIANEYTALPCSTEIQTHMTLVINVDALPASIAELVIIKDSGFQFYVSNSHRYEHG